MDAKGKGGGREVALGLNSGVFNSSVFNSGVFNNASFGSFSNLQDFPFFESLTSLGDLSALGAAFHQSVPSLPEHLAAAAAAQHAAATAAAAQQGSSANLSSLNLARNDSFANLTQSSLQNLQLFLTEVEQGVIASGQVQQQQQQQQQQHSPQLPSASPVQQQQQQQQHVHQSQQAQPLPPAAYAPVKATQAPPHHPALQPKAAPTPIAPAPIYPSPSQFAAFSPSMQTYPHPQQHSTQQWGPRPGLAGGNAAQSSPKLPLTPSSAMMMAQQSPSLAPIGGPAAGVAVPQEFSSTLYSLASTLPPPMILSNDSVLGSVGGGLHFQRHCVRRRMPDELAQPDPSMFLN